MSRGFYLNVSRAEQSKLPADPRFPIAQHISWVRPTGYVTFYHGLEPDNYNYAVLAARPVICDFIQDHVMYRDYTTPNWWTVYYVYANQWTDFNAWIQSQDCLYRWHHSKPATRRNKPGLLHNRANTPEFSFDEVLFKQGYYAKLSDQLFANDDKILLDRLGPVRAEVLKTHDFQQV
jgi:hypothetical protein